MSKICRFAGLVTLIAVFTASGAWAVEGVSGVRRTITDDFASEGRVWSWNGRGTGWTEIGDRYEVKVPFGLRAVVTVTRLGGHVDGADEEFYVYAFDEYAHYLKDGETRTYVFASDNWVEVGVTGSPNGKRVVSEMLTNFNFSMFVNYAIVVAYEPNDTPGVRTAPFTAPVNSSSAFNVDSVQTYRSVLRDTNGQWTGYGDSVIGVIELKTTKPSKTTGLAKISGFVRLFEGTKFRFNGSVRANTSSAPWASIEMHGLGTLNLLITSSGVTGNLNGSCEVEFAKVGGLIYGEAQFLMEQSDFIIAKAERQFDSLLPNDEPIEINGRKWITAKPGKVKGIMGSATEAETEGDNLSGLKLSYNDKTGEIKGSFTVYSMTKGKLKKHKAVISGALVSDRGRCLVTIKDANWSGVASIVGR